MDFRFDLPKSGETHVTADVIEIVRLSVPNYDYLNVLE